MSDLQKQQQHLPAEAGQGQTTLTVRELSTEKQHAWIDRVFTKLSAIFGSQFVRNWMDSDADEVKDAWAYALGGFEAEDIAAGLKACYARSTPPNAPEFAALCRQHMTARTKVEIKPLTPDEKAAAAVVAEKVAEGFKKPNDGFQDYTVNGALVTKYRTWAVALIEREASGESLPVISTDAWRELFSFPKDMSAKKALEIVKGARA